MVPFCAAFFLLHLRLEIRDRSLHHAGRVEHRRQLHLARAEQVADRPHAVQQDRVDEVKRRVVDQRFFQNLVERLLVRARRQPFSPLMISPLQLVFHRQRVDVRRRLLFFLPLVPAKCAM
jgi:hypothetical protein